MDISRPTLLLDDKIAKRNIRRMVDKARRSKVELKPHFKTHQSRIVGSWFKEEGVNAITVSSVSMAEYFADDGWQHITIAFPVNILEIDRIAVLASKVELTLLVTGPKQVRKLIDYVENYVNLLIEIDCGSKRSGLEASDGETIIKLIELLEGSQHHFKGFYSHFGHSYMGTSKDEVRNIFNESLHILTALQLKYIYAKPTISIGDTPSASLIDDFTKVKSIHAGNYVFYDLTQAQIGACKTDDIAIALACPVVSKSAIRQEVIIYGGGVHLSKESMHDNELNRRIYGKVVHIVNDSWSEALKDCFVHSISQEHGVVKLSEQEFERISVGDVIGILPVHSCMTADVMGGYKLFSGESVDHFKSIWAVS